MMFKKCAKKTIAAVLTFVLIFCCVSPAVFAVDLSESDQNRIDSYKEQQAALNGKIKDAQEKLNSLKSDIRRQQEVVSELSDQKHTDIREGKKYEIV